MTEGEATGQSMANKAGSALFWKGLQLSVTKIIYVARLLILARLLSPDDFGLFAIAAVVIGILLTLSDLGITPALIQQERVENRHYAAAWTLAILRALAISGLLFVAAPMVADLFAEPRSVNIIRALALRPVIEAMATVQIAKLNRNLEFRTMAFLKIPAALIDLVVAIGLANSLGVWALVAGILSGEAAIVILAYIIMPWRPSFLIRLEAVRPLVAYGKWIFLTGAVALVGSTVLQAVIARKLGAAELGLYYLALKIANLPSEVIGQIVDPVAFPLYARLRKNIKQIRRTFRTILICTTGLLLPVYALLIALAPSLTSNILGENWSGTVPVIQVLAVVGMISILSDVVVPLLNGIGQPNKVTLLEFTQSLLIVVFVWRLADLYGVVGAASALIPALIISQIMSGLFLRKIFGQPLKNLLSPIAVILVASLAGVFLARSLVYFLPGFIGFMSASLGGLVLILAILWTGDQRFNFGIYNDLLKVFPQLKSLSGHFKRLRT